MRKYRSCLALAVLAGSGLLLNFSVVGAATASTTTFWVTNQGLDRTNCGARATPCRSISAALARASDGDVIEVGAGLYGDLDGDGAFNSPGEEHLTTLSTGRTCLVCVTRNVKILSLHGAAQTLIDAGNSHRPDPNASAGRVDDIVAIAGFGATFGGANSGFTLTGSGGDGLHVQFQAATAHVSDNVARGNADTGFDIDVIDLSAPPDATFVDQYAFTGNQSTGNRVGFAVQHDETHQIPVRVYLADNEAAGNSAAGFALSGTGFRLQMRSNRSNGNGIGVYIGGIGYEITNNSVLGNAGPGIEINGRAGASGLRIAGNTLVGNRGPGVYLLQDSDGNTITGNNIYGNGLINVGGAGAPPATNCGIENLGFTGNSLPPSTLNATHNYWGSSSGPGVDPADNAGKGCDFNQGSTQVKPFATGVLPIVP